MILFTSNHNLCHHPIIDDIGPYQNINFLMHHMIHSTSNHNLYLLPIIDDIGLDQNINFLV